MKQSDRNLCKTCNENEATRGCDSYDLICEECYIESMLDAITKLQKEVEYEKRKNKFVYADQQELGNFRVNIMPKLERLLRRNHEMIKQLRNFIEYGPSDPLHAEVDKLESDNLEILEPYL